MLSFSKYNLNGISKGSTPESLAKKHGVSVDHIKSQLSMGVRIEKEHTKDEEIARIIATDHVYEDPNYYTKLKKIEKDS